MLRLWQEAPDLVYSVGLMTKYLTLFDTLQWPISHGPTYASAVAPAKVTGEPVLISAPVLGLMLKTIMPFVPEA